MANSYFVFALFAVSTTLLLGIHADETTINDIIQSSIDSTVGNTLDELGALTRLTGMGSHRSRYTPLPYRQYNYQSSARSLFGGDTYIRNVPDLINLVFGLGGHIVGRAGWIIHDAVSSLFDGLLTSQFKLRGKSTPGIFGHSNHDDIFDDSDLFGAGIADPDVYGGVLGGNDLLDLNFW
ncbi:hypothetical protein PoB_004262100 [Plakobranchus ocellatus]|uniref:Uncharacterized protein n=1 Tax=Plakobranchus ocellatus TaxID=259542 RepID=A0AAV4B6N2_9GAST|nr:hypothetical protein PoB_004262100 [Plakobranchus ocellatus]